MIEVQRHACMTLLAVLRGRSLTSELTALWQGYPSFSVQDRGAIQDLAYGACRWLGTLRALLGALVERPFKDAPVEALLLIALYQLGWTRAAAHAVVDSAVTCCAGLGFGSAKGLVNGVLRTFLREREQRLARARASDIGRFSYPQWWIDRVRLAWPQAYADVLDAGNAHPPLTLRVNRRRCSLADYRSRLDAAGIEHLPLAGDALRIARPMPVQRLPGFDEGLVSVQDWGAQFAAPLLDLRPRLRVLDACAAPGGKSAHILESEAVELLALDRDPLRLRRVQENLDRLRLSAMLVAADAADLQSWWDGRSFDRILLDAPCSASGVVRRHPDIKWLRRDQDIAQLATEQTRLLQALWQTLAPGGKLLFVTCSVFPEETHAQITAFLHTQEDAEHLPLRDFPQAGGQLLPDEEHDGFFYALLEKRPQPRHGAKSDA
ncbi:MAG: 16S rRNA (cytosine(967)-C(5))-methyltransferase RsmB [Burkholderiales bacterium]|nr:16S rRNA (cytosine(967)-C(5))-methyltransferase RsmB [Burkholderiales bacterium]